MNKFYFKPIKNKGMGQTVLNRNSSFLKSIKLLLFSAFFLLKFSIWGQSFSIVGSGTASSGGNNTTAATLHGPFGNYYWGVRNQFFVTAAQLTAAGITSNSSISSLGFNVTTDNGTTVHTGFTIRVYSTTSTNPISSGYVTSNLIGTTSAVNVNVTTGWNMFNFINPFTWNGTDNLVVETCFNNSGFSTNAIVECTNSGLGTGTWSRWIRADNSTVCSTTTSTSTSTSTRPNMRFGWIPPSTAPTSITGTNTICSGGSTTLTTSGGSLGTDAVDLWSSGSCLDHVYFNPWWVNNFTSGSQQTTFNSTTSGTLNVTSTGGDPYIHMPSLGSFNPNTYRYVNVRFRATSVAQPGGIEIFWYNTLYTGANGAQFKNQAVSSTQNVWTTVSIDMLSPTAGNWLHSNVTGWRFDWATTTGVTMEIDFISLSNVPIVGAGSSISVSPTSTITYFTQKAGASNRTTCASQAVTVNALPSAGTVTSSPASGPICAGTSVTASVSGGSGGAGTITDVIEFSSNGGAWTTYSGAVTAAANSLQFRTRRTATGPGCTTSGNNTASAITVNAAPTANAGAALSNICRGTSTAQMGGSVGGGATGGTWSGGSGTWTNATNPSTAVYNAAANESGTITLTLTATAPAGCTNVTATKSLTFTAVSAAPTITGPICPGNTTVTGTGVNGSTIKVIRGGTEIQSGSATWTGSNWSITVSSVSAGESLTATQTESGKCVSDASSAYVVITPASWGNIQFPATSQSICGTPVTFYGQVYRAGTTEAAGQGASLTADLGWSSTNTNPNTWTNWTSATFNTQFGNNDEFRADLGAGLTEGTWYYAFRYTYAGCPIYGGYGGVYGSGGSNGTATVPASQTATLSSGAGTNAQTVCKGTAITNITYSLGNGANNATLSAGSLPSGVSASVSGGVLTITGTPSSSGTFSYTYTTSGTSNCAFNFTGSITVNETLDFVNLQFPATASICQGSNANLYGQVYEAGLTEAGGQGAGVTVDCGVNASNTNPNTWSTWTAASFNSQSGNNDEYIASLGSSLSPGTYYYAFRYSYNGCVAYGGYSSGGGGTWNGTSNVSGVLTVNPTNTAGTASSSPTLCINTTLTTITHATTSATGISNAGVSGANGLPAGVSATWSSNTISITGTPSESGTFSYAIPLTGGCGSINATGTIVVTPVNSAGAASSTPTLCNNSTLTTITHSTSGATGISNSGVSGANGLPAGVSATWSSNTISITGTPTVAGTYNYSIPMTGGCGSANATGTITVNEPAVNPITGTTTLCVGQTSTLGGNTTPFTVQSFTSVGTTSFTPPATGSAEVLVVAGGGGGGFGRGGGGGGGGVIYNGSYSVTAGTPITVTVGAGGTGAASNTATSSTGNGGNSVFGIITATGGGLGGSHNPGSASFNNGSAGGSGGGAAINYSGSSQWTGGAASPAGQGFAGGAGAGSTDSPRNTGGGGGAGAAGVSPGTSTSTPPNGGVGLSYSISGSAVFYGGGGGGANGNASGESFSTAGAGTGGNGGGGNGAAIGGNPTSGAANTGGGGGGGGAGGSSTGVGGNGGSGIVIVRYPTSTWSWTSSNTSVATVNVSTGVVTAVGPGTTTITFTLTSGGCSNSVSTTVTVNPAPTASASSNSPVCQGNTLNLTGTTNTGTSFSWTGPNGFTSTLQNPTITNLTAAAAGTYTFTATSNGCSTSGTTVVATTAAATNVNAGSDVAVCAGLGTSLSASSTAPSITNTFTGSAITINASGNATSYPSTINVSNFSGSITNIKVNINNFSHTFPADVDIVLFGPTGAHSIIFTDALSSSAITGRNYTFQIGATALSTSTASASGTYGVVNGSAYNGTGTPSAVSSANLSNFVGTNPNGTWSLFVFDDASGDAGTIGSWSIELTINADVSYSWSPSTFLSATNVANPTASNMLSTQTYTVTATSNGCSNTDQVVVTVNNPTVTTTRTANDFVWTGSTSTAWNVTSNWLQWDGSAYTIPAGFPNASTANVILPTDNANGGVCVPNEARIGAYTIAINNLAIETNHAFQLNNASARLNVNGAITNNGTWNTPTAGSIVDYNASGSQSILNATYSNLQTSGSGTKTLTGITTVSSTLTIGSGTTFALSSRTLRITGTGTTPIVNNGTWSEGTSTVDFRNASNQNVPALNYYNLNTNSLNTGGVKTLSGDITVSNILTLGDGTTLTLGSSTLNLGGASPIAYGTVAQTGTISMGTGTINYSRNGVQDVAPFAYYNLGTTGTGVKTLTGSASVSNALALTNGVLTLGANTLTMNGSTMTRTSGSIDASNSSATLVFGNSSLLTLPSGVFSAAVNNMTLSGTRVKSSSDFTVNGTLNLSASNPDATNGLLDLVQSYGNYANAESADNTDANNNLNSAVLTLGSSATITGSGDITGKVRRTSFTDGSAYSFGNPNLQVTLSQNGGTMPSSITVVQTKGTEGLHVDKNGTHDTGPNGLIGGPAVQRLFQVMKTGGTSEVACKVRLPYLDSELNGNTEANLVTWMHEIPFTGMSPHEQGKTNNNTTSNWVELDGFSIDYLATEGDAGQTKYWMLSDRQSSDTLWIGGASNQWSNTANWSSGILPTTTTRIVVDPLVYKNSLTMNNSYSIGSMEIKASGVVNAGSNDLTLNQSGNTWINVGTFNAGTGKVIFNTPNGTLSGATQFNDLEISTSKSATIQTGSVISISGTITNSGTLDATSNSNTIVYNGSGQVIPQLNGTTPGYYNLTVDQSSGTAITDASISTVGDLVLDAGTLDMQSGYDLTIGGDLINNASLVNNTNVYLTGTSTQSIAGTNPTTFEILAIMGTNNTVTSNQDIIVNQVLFVGADNTLNGGDKEVKLNGSGDPFILEGSFVAGTGTVNYASADATNVLPLTYYNLKSEGASVKSLTGNATVSNNLTIDGSEVNVSTNVLSISNGPIASNGGTLRVESGTLELNNASNIALSSGLITNNTFNQLSLLGAGDVVINDNMTVNGNMTLTAGKLDLGSTTLTMETTAAMSRTSGLIDASGAGIIMKSGVLDAAAIEGGLINSLEVDRSGDVVEVNNANLEVTSAFTLTNGTLDINSNELKLSGSITHSAGAIDADAGTIDFNNAGAYTLSTGLFSGDVYGMKVSGNGGLVLSEPIRVSNLLTMNGGNITTDVTKLLEVGSSVSSTGSVNWTTGTVVGPMKRWFAASTNATAASGIFPVGTATVNRYAKVNFTQAPSSGGYIVVKFNEGTPPDAYSNFPITYYENGNTNLRKYIQNADEEGYWDMTPYSADGTEYGALDNSNYKLQLRINVPTSVAEGGHILNDPPGIRLIRAKGLPGGAHEPWSMAGTYSTYIYNSSSDVVIESNNVTGFSWFNGGGNNDNPLPVSLLSFSGECLNDSHIINWSTASEHNSESFEVQVSRDGTSWNTISTMAAAGNSNSLINYNYVNENAGNDALYYRLRQLDNNGDEKMYDPIFVSCSSTEKVLLSFPNPSSSNFKVLVNDQDLVGEATVVITDSKGMIVAKQDVQITDGTNMILFEEQLPSGIYYLQIKNGRNSSKVLKHSIR